MQGKIQLKCAWHKLMHTGMPVSLKAQWVRALLYWQNFLGVIIKQVFLKCVHYIFIERPIEN